MSVLHIPLRYNVRSLRRRWLTTLLTVSGVALVVATFVALMALAAGLSNAIAGGTEPANVVLLYRGGISEALSRVTVNQFQTLRFLPQLAQNSRGEPLASLEALININCERPGGGTTLVLFRGLRPIGFQVHRRVRLRAGRWFTPGSDECVVGAGLAQRATGMSIGKQLRVGRREFRIVGLLEASGTAFESELWGDLDDVVGAAQRDWFNSVTVTLKAPSEFAAFEAAVKSDPRIELGARTEADYYEEQAAGAEGFRVVGLLVAFFMAVGAALAEMNTMFSAIASRTREIGTLRALGFRRRDVLTSFLAEAVLLAVPGGALGCFAGSWIDGQTMSVLSMSTISEVVFRFRVTPDILAMAFAFSLVLGLVGGMLPALQAARLPVLDALRRL